MDGIDELGKLLHDLAVDIADTVNCDFVPVPPKDTDLSATRPITLDDKIDAFKALSPFYLAYIKAAAKLPKADDEKAPNFGNFKRKLQAVEGGKE